ncbi:MAG TPA: hypothetical protein VI139_04960 [Gemmatimonadales bacterium]
MTTDDGARSRWGLLGGLAGSVIGGFTWVVVGGLVAHQAAFVAGGIAAAAVVFAGAVAAAARFPARPLGVLGATILAIVLFDGIFLTLLLPRLPESAAGLYYGTSRTAFARLRPLVLAASIAGVVLVVLDLLRQRDT